MLVLVCCSLFFYSLIPLFSSQPPTSPTGPSSRIFKKTALTYSLFFLSSSSSAFVGWLSDLPGLRKKIYLVGLVLTALSTVAFALGRKIWILLLGRIALSLSSSIVRSAGMAMLKDSSAANKQGRTMGYVAIPQALGQLAGPLISGLLYEKVSYAAVWIAMGGILGVDAIARLIVSDPGADNNNQQRNDSGAAAHGKNGSASPDTPICAGGASQHETAAASATAAAAETSPPHFPEESDEQSPLLLKKSKSETPPIGTRKILQRFFLDQRVILALWLCFVQALLRGSFASTLPLFLHRTFGTSSGTTGVFYLLLTVPIITSIFIGILFDYIGADWITATGLIIGIPSYTCLRFITHQSADQVALLVILLLLCGLVKLLIGVPSMAVCSTVASEMLKPYHDKGHAVSISGQVFSAVRTTRAIGLAVGPIFGAVTVTRIGWGGLMAVLGGICAASLIAVVARACASRLGCYRRKQ